jgi:hypothetical protein
VSPIDFGAALGYADALALFPATILAPYDPRIGTSNASALNANDARGQRVICRKTGVLTDLAVFVGTSSGNVDIGVYDDTATTRNKLYSSGSVACGTANTWQLFTGITLAVVAGRHYDLALACDNATATFGRAASFTQAAAPNLPTNFWPAPNGGVNKLHWVKATAFPLPSTIAESAFTTATGYPFIMGRIV